MNTLSKSKKIAIIFWILLMLSGIALANEQPMNSVAVESGTTMAEAALPATSNTPPSAEEAPRLYSSTL